MGDSRQRVKAARGARALVAPGDVDEIAAELHLGVRTLQRRPTTPAANLRQHVRG